MHLRIAARQQLAVLIRNIDFGIERAACQIDSIGGTHYFALEFLSGILGQLQIGGESGAHSRRKEFWNADVDTDGIGLRQKEKLLSGASVPGVNKIPNVYVASREHAAERRIDVFERFELFQAPNIGLSRLRRRAFRREIAHRVVDLW